MTIYDISRPLSQDTAVYKNYEEKRFAIRVTRSHQENGVHESEIRTNLHTGTHIDAPLHMVEGGQRLGEIDLHLYYGECYVYDLTAVSEVIRAEDLLSLDIKADTIVLFKTRNSYDEGWNAEFVYVGADAASYLVAAGVRTVGLDAMSIERGSAHHATHRILLGAGLGIIEDVRLAGIKAGRYTISCLPLSIPEAEASPVRAILISD